MVLTNNDPAAGGFPITDVTPAPLEPSHADTTCSAPVPPTVASIAVNGGTATITYTCTIGSLGEIAFDGVPTEPTTARLTVSPPPTPTRYSASGR